MEIDLNIKSTETETVELIDLDQYLIESTDTETVALIDLDQYLITSTGTENND